MWNRRTSNFTWLFRSIGRRCFCMAHLPLQQLHIFPQSPVLRRQGQCLACLLQGQSGPPRMVKRLTAQIMGQAAPRLRLADVGAGSLLDRQRLTGGIQHTVPHLPLHPATHPQSPQYGVRPCVIDKKKPVVPHGSNKNFSVCCHGTLDKSRLLIYEITNGCGGDTRSAGRIPVALVALSWQLKKIFWKCPTHWISKETSA